MTYWYAMGNGMWGWVMGPLGLVLMLAFWALLIGGGIMLFHHLTGGSASSAERELARRFAVGEIDEDEFHHRREVLRATTWERSWSGGPTR